MTKLDNGVIIDELTWTSPNFTPSHLVAQVYGIARFLKSCTIHHWDNPKLNPTFDGIASHLCRRGGNTSAHFIVQGRRVACIVPVKDAAWHAGNAEGNATSVGIECDPWASEETMQTVAALIRWLESVAGRELLIYMHKQWSATACPGAYVGKIADLVKMVNAGPGSSTPAPASVGLTWPVEGFRVTQAFNGGQNLATNLGGGHTGVDWATPVGTPVKAVADGTVLWADWARNLPRTNWADRWFLVGGGFGNTGTDAGITTVIDHGGYLTVSSHLNETPLNAGDRVTREQIIGKTGATGVVSGPHLHFEVIPKPFAWSNGFYGRVDPVGFIQARLAPPAAQEKKDWFDMATKEDLKAAFTEFMEAPFKREGPEAAKIWPRKDQTSSFGAVLRWTDEAWIQINRNIATVHEAVKGLGSRIDALEKAKPATTIQGVTLDQLRAIVREELDRTKLGGK